LIDAFSQVRKKINTSRLVIVGNGPLLGGLEKMAKDLGVSPWILFTGYRNDVFELLKGFDIFVLPSLAEGLSIALLEAMAMRLPVIASHVGGIPEVFGEWKCGKLVPPKDVSAISAAMLEGCSLSGDQKWLLGENGRKRIEEEFTVDIMLNNLIRIYESVISCER
jgi:glycosyltransferase involved in cell wall biosynthesis